jgi:hypothetical protein
MSPWGEEQVRLLRVKIEKILMALIRHPRSRNHQQLERPVRRPMKCLEEHTYLCPSCDASLAYVL